MLLIFTTVDEKAKATSIGKTLLEKRMIACYNMWPVESGYWWKGEIVTGGGYTMLLKSTDRWFEDVTEIIAELSGDETPEVIAVASERVDQPYQRWLNEEIA